MYAHHRFRLSNAVVVLVVIVAVLDVSKQLGLHDGHALVVFLDSCGVGVYFTVVAE